jgi:CheY-like chemotaxis protein
MTRDEVPPRHTTHLRGLVASSPVPAASPQPTTGTLDASLPWVIELRIVGTVTTLQFTLGASMLLGRDDPEHDFHPEIDLTPHNALEAGVSRKHAIILSQEGRVSIKDLNSANGTKLNGFQLGPGMEYKLESGDELALGELSFQVRFAVASQNKDANQASPSMPVQRPANGNRVLIIEDDADVSMVFQLGLEKAGYDVTVTANATAALAALTTVSPDLIVTDLDLPDLNGLDLIQYVRRHEEGRHIPLIVVSASTGGFQSAKALEAGADVFLGKPMMLEDLIQAVDGALKVYIRQKDA